MFPLEYYCVIQQRISAPRMIILIRTTNNIDKDEILEKIISVIRYFCLIIEVAVRLVIRIN